MKKSICGAIRFLSDTLVKIGRGIYAKAQKTNYDTAVPKGYVVDLARSALRKFGVKTFASKAEIEYNSRGSAQVPTGRVILP